MEIDYDPAPPETVCVKHQRKEKLTAGDVAECRYAPGLLRVLMTKSATGIALATGSHPMSGLPVGMAVHAAIQVCEGAKTGIAICRAVDAKIESPMGPDEAIISRASIKEVGGRHVVCESDVFATDNHSERLIAHAQVVLVRVVDGKAAPINDDSGIAF